MSKDSQSPLFEVQTESGESSEYDVVIVATPMITGQPSIKFSGSPTDLTEHKREYQNMLAYVVEGVPNYEYFGFDNLKAMPDEILCLDMDNWFVSIEVISPVAQPL